MAFKPVNPNKKRNAELERRHKELYNLLRNAVAFQGDSTIQKPISGIRLMPAVNEGGGGADKRFYREKYDPNSSNSVDIDSIPGPTKAAIVMVALGSSASSQFSRIAGSRSRTV